MTTHMSAPIGIGRITLCESGLAAAEVSENWDLVDCPDCLKILPWHEPKPPVVHMRAPSGIGRITLCESGLAAAVVSESWGTVDCPECLGLCRAKESLSEYGESLKRQVGGDHYKSLDIQPWEAMSAWHPEQFAGYLHLSAIKYLARAGKKDSYLEDIKKAHHYLERLLEELGEGT